MRRKISLLLLLAAVGLNGCSIFRPGCHCPKVVHTAGPQAKTGRNS
ncbi:hypothetical protein [Pedobacter cryoconitis]|uniref:Lipoprotein n=1 Tax=Pedobacter cryoconitis TaxID=188932 RepID=A0A7X0J607_9SPHI|nr:hypothetical protein [Pedobacter cryoconitis]MBB6501480.1 hypothetical protein [Pedobacter cryoconitis]